jgi:hypothetical protein
MKVNLSGDTLQTDLYDRDNGEGAAEKAIAQLKVVPTIEEEEDGRVS